MERKSPRKDICELIECNIIHLRENNNQRTPQSGRFLRFRAKKNPTEIVSTSVGLRGGDGGARTHDLFDVNEAL